MSRVSISPILFGGAVCTHMNADVKFVSFVEISLIVLTVQFEFLLESIDTISRFLFDTKTCGRFLFDTKHVVSL